MPVGNVYSLDDLPDLKGYVSNNKRTFTRIANQVLADCNILQQNYTPQLSKALERDYLDTLKPKVESIHDRLDIILSIEGLSEPVTTQYTKMQKEVGDKMDEVTAKFQEVMSMANTAAANEGPAPQPKAVTELRPDKLEKGFSPSQLAHWISQFRTYWNQSRFSQLSNTDQQNILFTNITTQLGTTLGLRFLETMPVFSGDDTEDCIDIITAYWLEQNPLLSRRLELFRASQSSNQKFSSFIAHLTRMEQGCDINSLTGEQVFCLLLLKSCSDDNLLTELLKQESFENRKDIERLTLEYERRERNASALNKLKGSANRTGSSQYQQQKNNQRNKDRAANNSNSNNSGSGSSNNSSNKSNSGGGKNKDSSDNKGNKKKNKMPQAFKDRCLHCGDKSHKSMECTKKADTKCSFCDNKGSHNTNVCFKKYWNDNPQEGSASANMAMAFMAKGLPKADPPPMMEVEVKPLNQD